MSADPTRSLPDRPDLEQQKKLAKELLAAYAGGDAAAHARVRAQLPDKPRIGLADAQFVLAREYGFASWAQLKAHVEAARGPAPDPADRLRAAIAKADAAGLRLLLERDAEARALLDAPIFAFDAPALVHVAGSGDIAILEALLDAGADPNRRSDWWAGGWHALHHAQGRAAELLLARGAVPDACAAARLDRPELLGELLAADAGVHERGGDGQTPLHFARSRAVVDLLVRHGADLDARDVDHRSTPAQWMLERRRGAGRYALAEYLVALGAEADVFLACALGLVDRVREMVRAEPALLKLRTTRGDYGEKPPSSYHVYMWSIGANLSPLQVAAQFGQREVVTALAALADARDRFLAACADARADEAREIVRRNPRLVAELDAEEQRVLPDAAWAGNAAAVALMLELGFDPFTPGQDTGTVLHCAAWTGELACVRVVLRAEAAPALLRHREATHGATPLDWCLHGSVHCRNSRGDYAAIAKLLLEAGSPPPASLDRVPAEVRRVFVSS